MFKTKSGRGRPPKNAPKNPVLNSNEYNKVSNNYLDHII